MAASLSSEFPKLEIVAYEYDRKTKTVSNEKSLKVGINPSGYSLSFKKASREDKDIPKVDGSTHVPKIIELKEALSLSIILDSTGVVPGTNEVEDDLTWIKNNLARLDGPTHATRYVTIRWGMLQFVDGQLTDCKINCTYFNRNGIPLRAKVDLSFERVVDWMKEENQSPDLTHVRIVKAGDTLPLMCNTIYKDPSLYTKVAEANGMANFTNLQPGQKIYFPPLKPSN